MTTFRKLLIDTEQRLSCADVFFGHGYDSAHDEAVALVLAAAELPVDTGAEILDLSVAKQAIATLAGYLKRRIENREPVAYIIGQAWLGPLMFKADRRALVPRSPIMSLIMAGLAPWWQGPDNPEVIVDLCAGGGSIGVLAAEVFPAARLYLLDIDPRALALADENIIFHAVSHRVSVIQADLLAPIAAGTVDVILANPPYVDQLDMDTLPREYRHEPRHALAAGVDGLDLVHRIIAEAALVLRSPGLLVLEVGNSWPAMEAAYPDFAFIWLEIAEGGHGVTVLSADELQRLLVQQQRAQ